MQSMLIVNSLV